MPHTVFSLLKISILSHKPLRIWIQLKPNISTRHCCFVIVSAIYAAKTKIAWEMSHSSGEFQFQRRKILYRRYFCPVVCIAIKVTGHMTSDFDVYEVDQDMQISFLNAASYHIRVWLAFGQIVRTIILCQWKVLNKKNKKKEWPVPFFINQSLT